MLKLELKLKLNAIRNRPMSLWIYFFFFSRTGTLIFQQWTVYSIIMCAVYVYISIHSGMMEMAMIWWYCATVGNFCKTLYVVWVWVFVVRCSRFFSAAVFLHPLTLTYINPPALFLALSLTHSFSPYPLHFIRFRSHSAFAGYFFLHLAACVLCCHSVYYFDYYVFCIYVSVCMCVRMDICVLFLCLLHRARPNISG